MLTNVPIWCIWVVDLTVEWADVNNIIFEAEIKCNEVQAAYICKCLRHHYPDKNMYAINHQCVELTMVPNTNRNY